MNVTENGDYNNLEDKMSLQGVDSAYRKKDPTQMSTANKKPSTSSSVMSNFLKLSLENRNSPDIANVSIGNSNGLDTSPNFVSPSPKYKSKNNRAYYSSPAADSVGEGRDGRDAGQSKNVRNKPSSFSSKMFND